MKRNPMMQEPPRQLRQNDALRYTVVQKKKVTDDNVKVSLRIEMLVSAAIQDMQRIRADILAALRQLIKDAQWQMGPIHRETGAVVGFERVSVEAYANVHVRENFNLPSRAAAASRQGLTLYTPFVEFRVPAHKIEEAVRQMRLATLVRVQDDILDFNATTGRSWRLGDISFGINHDFVEHTAKGAGRRQDFADIDLNGTEPAVIEEISLVTDVCLHSDQVDENMTSTHMFGVK